MFSADMFPTRAMLERDLLVRNSVTPYFVGEDAGDGRINPQPIGSDWFFASPDAARDALRTYLADHPANVRLAVYVISPIIDVPVYESKRFGP